MPLTKDDLNAIQAVAETACTEALGRNAAWLQTQVERAIETTGGWLQQQVESAVENIQAGLMDGLIQRLAADGYITAPPPAAAGTPAASA